MKKNIILNKYYRKLRTNVFNDLDLNEFTEVYIKFKKLKFQYRLLRICEKLESCNITVIEIPLLRLLSKFIDFMRWKIYDFIMLIINGRVFNLYGVTCYCGRQRWWENNRNC